jgi:hypothetical protein
MLHYNYHNLDHWEQWFSNSSKKPIHWLKIKLFGDKKYNLHNCVTLCFDNTEATERILMESRDDSAQDFPIPAYYCNPLQPPLAYVNHTKPPVTSEGYRY